jgi:uncharacterized HhH-GPD family protein
MNPIALTLQPEADDLLSRDPLALLLGMLLDQQMPMERAFLGPYKLATRMGVERLSARDLSAVDPVEFEELCAAAPAIHRFPKAMASRIRALAAYIVEVYDGDTAAIWSPATSLSGEQLRQRLASLPGFGPAKAAIFTALLGKQCGVTPPGWREASSPYGEPGSFRSVADVVDHESLIKVRQTKQAAKAAAHAHNNAGNGKGRG